MACVLPLLTPTAIAQPIELESPIVCGVGTSCVVQNYVDHDRSTGARDYRCGTLTYDGHDGTDFRLATVAAQLAGVEVVAAASGQVLRVRDGVADELMPPADQRMTTGRECGNGLVISHGDEWETQYCHLARGSVRVKPGDRVVAGEVIGLVGLSGLTQFPHVHVSLRHGGKTVDPFAFGAQEGSCGSGTILWNARARTALAYRERAVLNMGFAAGPVKMEEIEAGEAGRGIPTTDAPALVAFVRSVGLRAHDEQRLAIKGPDGRTLSDHSAKPLDRAKAQYLLFAGKKRPDHGWPAGSYHATYTVTNAGKTVLEQEFAISLAE